MKYQEAFDELEQIVMSIEDGDIDVDELSDKVKRASKLIQLCSAKLKSTEEEVDQILKEMNSENEEKSE
jgi:exodeoxyribonuclease VII small subunit